MAGPALPPDLAYLWSIFCDLDRWRGAGMMGLAPLTLHDLDAYERRYGIVIPPDDADILKRLDFVRLAAARPAKGGK